MKFKQTTLVILGLLAAASCGKGVPLMGIDGHGNFQSREVSPEIYSENLEKVFSEVSAKTIPALEQGRSSQSWELKTVLVGLGLRTEVGVGPFKIGAEPRLRLAFSKHESPPIP